MRTYVLPLTQNKCSDSSLVGGKAARLAQLISYDFTVPPGFVLTTYAFEHFCIENNINLADKDIVNKITKGRFSKNLSLEIESVKQHFSHCKVAVRSSAIGEDGANFSMAGLLDTILYVNNIEDAIRSCWAALFSERVKSYTSENNDLKINKMGVIIQQLVEADYAGVLYTVDPLTKTGDFGIIEWVTGLADKLVDGSQTPERCRISRLTKSLDDLEDLSKHQLLQQLGDHAFKVESLLGFPVDIEWAIDGDRIYFLQARPITAFFTNSTKIVSSANITENYPGSIPPLTKDIAEHFYAQYLRCSLRYMGMLNPRHHTTRLFDSLLAFNSGHIYYNLSSWYTAFDLCSMSTWIRSGFDTYVGQNVPVAWQPKHQGRSLITFVKKIKDISTIFLKNIGANKKIRNFENNFKTNQDSWHSQNLHNLTPDYLNNLWIEVINWPENNWGPAGFSDFLVLITSGLIQTYANKYMPEEKNQALRTLLDGIIVSSTQSAKLINAIHTEIQKNSTLAKLLDDKKYGRLSDMLDGEAKALFLQFMQEFGGRSFNESMLVNPSFSERNDIFWNLVRNSHYEERSKYTDNHCLTKQKGSTFQRVLLKLLRKFASKALDHRERCRLIFGLYMAEVRRIVLEIGRRFREWDYIDLESDIFYLTSKEISDIFEDRLLFNSLKEIVDIRKKNHKYGESLNLPEFIVWEHGKTYEKKQSQNFTNSSRVLFGLGVSSGRVNGKACIVTDPSLAYDRVRGNILVTKTTDPGWTPLIASASGVVVERGGLLSHAAIVAREFGIPTIVGIDSATVKIQDGSHIEICGDTGTIEILETDMPPQYDAANKDYNTYV